MEQITKVIPQIKHSALTYEEHLKSKVNFYNSLAGPLKGYDCKKCLNRGYSAEIRDGKEVMVKCECTKKRQTLERLTQSGIADSIKAKTFTSFITTEPFQKKIKEDATEFVKSYKGKWFFIGGQNGCGKTHICTAISGQLLKLGKLVRYMLWVEESQDIKSFANEPEYKILIDGYQKAEVLYIDDLFKCGATSADIRLAYQILDYRCRKSMCTIISTEYTADEIYKIDGAIGSRIGGIATKINIPKDPRKDYRLKFAEG